MHRWIKGLITAMIAIGVLVQYNHFHIPAESIASAYYRVHALVDTGAENIVSAIYLNYRVFDSLFETLMLLISAMAVVRLSWRGSHE